jgi:hypothetical protein
VLSFNGFIGWSSRNFDKIPDSYEYFLLRSIEAYPFHVYNYVDLADYYFKKGKRKPARELVETALANVQGIYFKNLPVDTDPTDIEEFFNERIKGIHLTIPNLTRVRPKQEC